MYDLSKDETKFYFFKIQKSYFLIKKKLIMKILITVALIILSLNPKPTIESFIDSIIVTTSDSAASVWVRHKPITGALLCNVRTRVTSGYEVNLTLPQGKWSSWTRVESHLGSTSTKLTNMYMNDCSCVSEVKYFKLMK